MQKEPTLKELITKLVANWDTVRAGFILPPKEKDYSSTISTVIGPLWWDNPNLIWVLSTDHPEDYEGSQEQIGISKHGGIRWEYQSHCSCNWYENSVGYGDDFLLDKVTTNKSFGIDSVPEDWENIIKENIKKIFTHYGIS